MGIRLKYAKIPLLEHADWILGIMIHSSHDLDPESSESALFLRINKQNWNWIIQWQLLLQFLIKVQCFFQNKVNVVVILIAIFLPATIKSKSLNFRKIFQSQLFGVNAHKMGYDMITRCRYDTIFFILLLINLTQLKRS